ncbi:hypothetical protein DRP53_10435 [candidate division WOR-3 bacterium]|uniref:T9SS type A sorting domain-containing protein n=1 Tax=candidate division WOR-3 bacterium TaxID=2052148 RepID=A0A660SF04_UNCW3|nr:MAG: hypothetical protein DRP53_10435 [candidate division WOR-3 bacterium]
MKSWGIFLIPVIVLGQTNYVLKNDLLSAGGDTMAAPAGVNYRLFGGSITQTGVGRVENWNANYRAIIGFWHPPYAAEHIPPASPNIIIVEKLGQDAKITWNAVTIDTAGNTENVYYYVVYRDTAPDFVPEYDDSIGFTVYDETTYTDPGAVDSVNNFYYLIKAVDQFLNRSGPSNMGYKFRQLLYENPDRTDKNWVSLPFRVPYDSASDFYSDIGTGVCQGVTKRDPETQAYTTCIYLGGIWLNNFEIDPGQMYEISVNADTAVRITGAHDPDLSVPLYENPDRTDKNWISIPYNADYDSASDIYAHIGTDVCQGVTKRDPETQAYTTCIYLGGIWLNNFEIERGAGYEISVNQDTSLKPRVYTNRNWSRKGSRNVLSDAVTKEMPLLIAPRWIVKDNVLSLNNCAVTPREFLGGEAHICYGWLHNPARKDIHFRGYIVSRPEEVLTENTYGCGIMNLGDSALFWLETGNFYSPWEDQDKLIVLFAAESLGEDCIYLNPFGYASIILNERENRQKFNSFQSVTQLPLSPEVIGLVKYVISSNGEMLMAEDAFLDQSDISSYTDIVAVERGLLGYIFQGGHELRPERIAKSKVVTALRESPPKFDIRVSPSVVNNEAFIIYGIPRRNRILIRLYDPSGRVVETLVDDMKDPGRYRLRWKARPELSGGVYFVRIEAGEKRKTVKIVLTK